MDRVGFLSVLIFVFNPVSLFANVDNHPAFFLVLPASILVYGMSKIKEKPHYLPFLFGVSGLMLNIHHRGFFSVFVVIILSVFLRIRPKLSHIVLSAIAFLLTSFSFFYTNFNVGVIPWENLIYHLSNTPGRNFFVLLPDYRFRMLVFIIFSLMILVAIYALKKVQIPKKSPLTVPLFFFISSAIYLLISKEIFMHSLTFMVFTSCVLIGKLAKMSKKPDMLLWIFLLISILLSFNVVAYVVRDTETKLPLMEELDIIERVSADTTKTEVIYAFNPEAGLYHRAIAKTWVPGRRRFYNDTPTYIAFKGEGILQPLDKDILTEGYVLYHVDSVVDEIQYDTVYSEGWETIDFESGSWNKSIGIMDLCFINKEKCLRATEDMRLPFGDLFVRFNMDHNSGETLCLFLFSTTSPFHIQEIYFDGKVPEFRWDIDTSMQDTYCMNSVNSSSPLIAVHFKQDRGVSYGVMAVSISGTPYP